MVIICSMSEKKAIYTTRQVLDLFLPRMGNDVWSGHVTDKGLQEIYVLLKRFATKDTAVSCHWIRGRNRQELCWIVGNRRKFNHEGIVPVNSTSRDFMHMDWESSWNFRPVMQAVVAVAALLHDIGKANDFFQKMIKYKTNTANPIRHEWLSCLIISRLVELSGNFEDDTGWLEILLKDTSWEKDVKKWLANVDYESLPNDGKLPPIAQGIVWLIMSHHRMPVPGKSSEGNPFFRYKPQKHPDAASILKSVHCSWGYANLVTDNKILKNNLKYVVWADKADKWKALLKEWGGMLLKEREKAARLICSYDVGGTGRPFLTYCRFSLMLADYYISSQPSEAKYDEVTEVYANTDEKGERKQKLYEHLARVAEKAVHIVTFLPGLSDNMENTSNVSKLRGGSSGKFMWQGRIKDSISAFRDKFDIGASDRQGFFITNEASTGYGKTRGNAKIEKALSSDRESLRFSFALGLRTLTLQTGDSFRDDLSFSSSDLAVVIGSAAVTDLHNMDRVTAQLPAADEDREFGYAEENIEDFNSYLQYLDMPSVPELNVILPKDTKGAEEKAAFLFKPVLVSTIDSLMNACESTRGKRYMLPILRLMSSDLVLDEVDDFNENDLYAVARLIYLSGMFGRNVIISSATIEPSLARGLFSAYAAGYAGFCSLFGIEKRIACGWCDEFHSAVEMLPLDEGINRRFSELHQAFNEKRLRGLDKKPVKRMAYVADCTVPFKLAKSGEKASGVRAYFEIIRLNILKLHQAHSFVDRQSGKRVSFGLIRMANVSPCAYLGKYLAGAAFPENIQPKIAVYHSRQVLLLRHELEKSLDEALCRKGKDWQNLTEPNVRRAIDESDADEVIFLLVTTPVEEVGRDHDFDWAIVEPSSVRSIIQLLGRVLRHRDKLPTAENACILQYPWKALFREGAKHAYSQPGFENKKRSLPCHDFSKLGTESLLRKVDASPRIMPGDGETGTLMGIEHKAMREFADMERCGFSGLHGLCHEAWWMTGAMQLCHPFRDGQKEVELHRFPTNTGFSFKYYVETRKEWIPANECFGSIQEEKEENWIENNRKWVDRSYLSALKSIQTAQSIQYDIKDEYDSVAIKYGGVSLRLVDSANYYYSDQLGLYRAIDFLEGVDLFDVYSS